MKIFYYALPLLFLLVIACGDDDNTPEPPQKGDLEDISFNAQAYELIIPEGFPQMDIPADNPMTIEGVQLGQRLFFDKILSADGTMACAGCHLPEGAYTDELAVSEGIDGIAGRRSSMSVLNAGFFDNGLFWDGRSSSLEEQAALPVEDPIELHESWPNVETKLRQDDFYPSLFRKAFGIKDRSEISKNLAVKAIAQYERALIAGYNSKYDRVFRREEFFSDDEQNGFDMYFDLKPDLPDAECGHCHNAPLFTVNEYFNNGLDTVASLDDFEDLGRGEVTGKRIDNGKFRAPSLRNIAISAPYMHDGRFQTLEEVVDHYNSGGFIADNLHPLIRPLGLSDEQKEQLITFLHALTDTSYLEDPLFADPFK